MQVLKGDVLLFCITYTHTQTHTKLIFPSSFFSIKYCLIRFMCSFQQLFSCSHHEEQQDLIIQHLCHARFAQLKILKGQTLHLCFHWYLFPFLKGGAFLRLRSEKINSYKCQNYSKWTSYNFSPG